MIFLGTDLDEAALNTGYSVWLVEYPDVANYPEEDCDVWSDKAAAISAGADVL